MGESVGESESRGERVERAKSDCTDARYVVTLWNALAGGF